MPENANETLNTFAIGLMIRGIDKLDGLVKKVEQVRGKLDKASGASSIKASEKSKQEIEGRRNYGR